MASEAKPPFNLLVIGSSGDDWSKYFKGRQVGDREVLVSQSQWEDIQVAFHEGSAAPQCNIRGVGVVYPDFVLVRKLTRGLSIADDHRNKLFGLMMGRVPSCNSLHSIYMCLDRPPVIAEMMTLHEMYGARFPMIPMSYYSSYRVTTFTPSVPFVAKVGFAEAGYGKMLFKEEDTSFKDFVGCFATHGEYITAEKFYDKEYDIRVQKIGKHIRGYTRHSSNWKGNVGTSHLKEIPQEELPASWIFWAEKAATMFGGLDILTVDAIHMSDGSEVIIEINDTASGLFGPNKDEDMTHIADLVIQRATEEVDGVRGSLTQSNKVRQLTSMSELKL